MPSLPGLHGSPALSRVASRSRLLFSFAGRDLSLVPRTDQVATFARASIGGAIGDDLLRLYTPIHSQPRFDAVDTDDDGVANDVGILLEFGRSNLITQSENFGAWSVTNTPVLTAGQDDPFGGTAAYLVADDDAVNVEYIRSPVFTMTGNVEKGVSVFVKKGTAAPSGALINLRDLVAVADRLVATVNWTGSVPNVSMTTGQLLKVERRRGGWYRLHFRTTIATAANNHELHIRPAGNAAAETGTLYVFGAQVENAPYPSSYRRTSGSAVASVTDRLTYPANLSGITAATDDFTIYARVARPNHADASGTFDAAYQEFPGIFSLGCLQPFAQLFFSGSSRGIVAQLDDAGSAHAVATSAAIPSGAVIEVLMQLKDLAVTPAIALDVGAGLSAFFTNGLNPILGFGSKYGLGEINDGAHTLGATLFEAKVARGLYSMAEMREAL